MTKVRSEGDAARASLFYRSKALQSRIAEFESRDAVLANGTRKLDALLVHMTKDNIKSLEDRAALELAHFEQNAAEHREMVGGILWISADQARDFLQAFDEEDDFFTPADPAAPRPRGGRPRAEWAERLELAASLHVDEGGYFERRAELQRWIAEWLGSQNIHPGESTLKRYAERIWTSLGLEDQN